MTDYDIPESILKPIRAAVDKYLSDLFTAVYTNGPLPKADVVVRRVAAKMLEKRCNHYCDDVDRAVNDGIEHGIFTRDDVEGRGR